LPGELRYDKPDKKRFIQQSFFSGKYYTSRNFESQDYAGVDISSLPFA